MTHLPAHRHRAFLDSSAYFGIFVEDAVEHRQAAAIYGRLERERWRVFTTNFVIAETHALLLNRRGRDLAARALRSIDESSIVIVRASQADERFARRIISQYDDKTFSLTDAISFAVMMRYQIGHAFSFDRHFAQFGFLILDIDN